MFGRKPRTKSLEQVRKELDLLRAANVRNAFFVDDNFIGNKRAAKELLRFLRDYQREHDYRFRFGTEASLNLAHDDELLALFREAEFAWVFIGIESPDEDSLRETRKFQNTRQDILSSVRHIYSYGIDVLGGFIVGFDHDTIDTFERQYQLITTSGIQTAMVGLLTAVPKTPLYERLAKEGRLVADWNSSDNTQLGTNVIPKQMGYDEMVSRYQTLQHRLVTHRNIADRIKNKIRYLTKPPVKSVMTPREQLRIFVRLVVGALLPGGIGRLFQFFRSLAFARPRLIPVVVEDWIVGLSMRDYAERHYVAPVERAREPARGYLRSFEKAFRHYVHEGALEISFDEVRHAAANLSISMKGWLDRRFFTRAARHLEQVLEGTTSCITLHIEELHETQRRHLKRLLDRLSRYGDRVHVAVREELRGIIEIDSSVFNLVLDF